MKSCNVHQQINKESVNICHMVSRVKSDKVRNINKSKKLNLSSNVSNIIPNRKESELLWLHEFL